MKMNRSYLEDIGRLRPWLENGKAFVQLKDGRIVAHDPATSVVGKVSLTKKQWDEQDALVVQACKYRMVVTNLIGGLSGILSYEDLPSTHMVVEQVSQGSPAESPHFKLEATPLPITWVPLDGLGMVEAAARRVGECVERTVLGVEQHQLGGQALYGIFNHPHTIKLTRPAKEVTGSSLHLERAVETMLGEAISRKFYGPWVLLHSSALDKDFDCDPSDYPSCSMTVREKVCVSRKVCGVDVQLLRVLRADHLTGMKMALVQVTPDVIRLVVGLKPTLVIWENEFRVLTITVPQIKTSKGVTGIVTLSDEEA